LSGAEVKVPFWERKLSEYVGSLESEPFAWGQLDCAIFAHQCLIVQFGSSKIPDFRGKYKTIKGAMSALKKQSGFSNLEDAVSSYLDEINPKLAQRGDIVSLKINNPPIEGIGCSLGVCMGARYAVLTTQGVAYIESAQVDRAWRAAR
jgi:hypothetical protein